MAPVLEALDDGGHALDLVERQRASRSAPGAASSAASLARSVWSSTSVGVLLEEVEALLARGVLEFLHRAGIEQVELAVAAPLVLTVVA